LLKALTNMNVKIAGTTMTTLRPNIGTVPGKDKTEFGFKIADLPGLIDGAHAGKGVGEHFLSMIERNRTHLIVIDINGFQFDKKSPKRDAFDSLMLILGEVMQYDPDFLSRSFGLIVNKCENADVLISDFKSQLANQAATRATREYAIPVPEEHVKFSFIEYVSALHLTSDDKKSIIGNLREQLRSTGYIYERPEKPVVNEKPMKISVSIQKSIRLKERLVAQSDRSKHHAKAPEHTEEWDF